MKEWEEWTEYLSQNEINKRDMRVREMREV